MNVIKYILNISYCPFLLCLMAFQASVLSFADQLEGHYIDQTSANTITLIIKSVGSNEVLISDPQKTLISQPLKVSIIDKKENDLAGIKFCTYVTSDKNVRFSEINGSITLSLFTNKKAFVGKRKSDK